MPEGLFDLITRQLAGGNAQKQRDDLLVGGVQSLPVQFEKDFRYGRPYALVSVYECVSLSEMVCISCGACDEISTLVVLTVLSRS